MYSFHVATSMGRSGERLFANITLTGGQELPSRQLLLLNFSCKANFVNFIHFFDEINDFVRNLEVSLSLCTDFDALSELRDL